MIDDQLLKKQYDTHASDVFSRGVDYKAASQQRFYSLPPTLDGLRVLDAGCGDGSDLQYYASLGAHCVGIDTSPDMIRIAKRKVLESRLGVRGSFEAELGDFEHILYPEKSFDVVLSKYALQTSWRITPVLVEFARVLKPGGLLQYLCVHPMRQFIERRKQPQDYFEQVTVESQLFDGKVTVREPTHTFNDYFPPEFFTHFDMMRFVEDADFPASERIGGQNYPCNFIVQATRRFH